MPFLGETDRAAAAAELLARATTHPTPSGWSALPRRALSRLLGSSRRAHEARAALAACWSVLPTPAREGAKTIDANQWPEIVRPLATHQRPSLRAGVATLAADLLAAPLAPVVMGLLGDPDPNVRAQAERALVALADHAVDRGTPDQRRALLDVLHAPAAANVPSGRVAAALVRVAMSVSPEVADASLQRLADSGPAALTALQAALRRGDGDQLAVLALRWLPRDRLAAAAIDRLAQPHDTREWTDLLARSPLALRPARADRLRLLGRRPAPAPDLARLPDESRRRWAAWVLATAVPQPRADALLEPLLVDPDPLARLAGAHAASLRSAWDFAFDPDERVAASAARRLAPTWTDRLRAAPPRAAIALARSPHPSVRAIMTEAAEGAFLSPAWRQRLAHDPQGVRRTLADALADPATARPAASAIATLGLAPDLVEPLAALARGPDPRAAATAIATLATAPAASARAVVLEAAEHPDDRVRANAADALARWTGEDPEAFVSPMWSIADGPDRAHRERANAARGLARSGEPLWAARRSVAFMESSVAVERAAGAWLGARLLGAYGGSPSPVWFDVLRALRGLEEDAHDLPRRRAMAGLARIGSGPRAPQEAAA